MYFFISLLVFIFIAIFSILAGRKSLRENYIINGQLDSRLIFVLFTLGINQILVAILTIIFVLLFKVAYMFVSVIVFLDIISIIFISIFSIFAYTHIRKSLSESSVSPNIINQVSKGYSWAKKYPFFLPLLYR
jgi:hypothetical protein